MASALLVLAVALVAWVLVGVAVGGLIGMVVGGEEEDL